MSWQYYSSECICVNWMDWSGMNTCTNTNCNCNCTNNGNSQNYGNIGGCMPGNVMDNNWVSMNNLCESMCINHCETIPSPPTPGGPRAIRKQQPNPVTRGGNGNNSGMKATRSNQQGGIKKTMHGNTRNVKGRGLK